MSLFSTLITVVAAVTPSLHREVCLAESPGGSRPRMTHSLSAAECILISSLARDTWKSFSLTLPKPGCKWYRI